MSASGATNIGLQVRHPAKNQADQADLRANPDNIQLAIVSSLGPIIQPKSIPLVWSAIAPKRQ